MFGFFINFITNTRLSWQLKTKTISCAREKNYTIKHQIILSFFSKISFSMTLQSIWMLCIENQEEIVSSQEVMQAFPTK